MLVWGCGGFDGGLILNMTFGWMGNGVVAFGWVGGGVMTLRRMGSMESPLISCINLVKLFATALQSGKGVVGVSLNI
jgi:hypothetical protein